MLITPEVIPPLPDLAIELETWNTGVDLIAGVDEVGRGPLAGPVVAGAVILRKDTASSWLGRFADSKVMKESQREAAYEAIVAEGVDFAVGACSADEIDTIGILAATKLAMARAIDGLSSPPQHLLVDALQLEAIALPQTGIIKGDSVSLSIAAASVVAKVTRDRLMAGVFEERFPEYGFASHKGYGTSAHMAALRQHGPCEIHRTSFRPVRELCEQGTTRASHVVRK